MTPEDYRIRVDQDQKERLKNAKVGDKINFEFVYGQESNFVGIIEGFEQTDGAFYVVLRKEENK